MTRVVLGGLVALGMLTSAAGSASHVSAHVVPTNWHGACPHTFQFTAAIVARTAGTVNYHWERSDQTRGPRQSVTFSHPGDAKTVKTDWAISRQPGTFHGWQRVQVENGGAAVDARYLCSPVQAMKKAMKTSRVATVVAVLAAATSTSLVSSTRATSAADRKLVVGISPVDTASIDGADESASVALAKLLRIEMIKNLRLQTVLLASDPVDGGNGAAADASAAARLHADVVLKSTILAADSDQSSRDVNSPGFLGGNLSVGGKLARSTATVSVHLELVDPKSGDTIDSFDVQSKSSQTGVGTNLQTALGGIDNDASADKSPMGEALRGAAAKVSAEIAKRADRLTPKS